MKAHILDRRTNTRLLFSIGMGKYADACRWWTGSRFAFVSIRLTSGRVYGSIPGEGVCRNRWPPPVDAAVRLGLTAKQEAELSFALETEIGRPFDYLGTFRTRFWPGEADYKDGMFDSEYIVSHLQPFGYFLGKKAGAWTVGDMWARSLAPGAERLTILPP